MNDKVVNKRISLLNCSDHILEVWLEWDVADKYEIAPGQSFFVHAVTRDLGVNENKEPEWGIFLDTTNNAMSIYMPGDLSLAEDFYLTDSKTFNRIEAKN